MISEDAPTRVRLPAADKRTIHPASVRDVISTAPRTPARDARSPSPLAGPLRISRSPWNRIENASEATSPEAVIPGRSEAEGKGIHRRFNGLRRPWVPFPRFARRGRRPCVGLWNPRIQASLELRKGPLAGEGGPKGRMRGTKLPRGIDRVFESGCAFRRAPSSALRAPSPARGEGWEQAAGLPETDGLSKACPSTRRDDTRLMKSRPVDTNGPVGIVRGAPSSPPPLWGRDREGGLGRIRERRIRREPPTPPLCLSPTRGERPGGERPRITDVAMGRNFVRSV